MTSFHPSPGKPKLVLPRGACETHVHIFGPASVFPHAESRPFTPKDASKDALFALHRLLGIVAHIPHAQKADMSTAKIDALRGPFRGAAFDADERALLALADAMTRDVQVDDALFAPPRARFDNRGIGELVATIAAYNMVSPFLRCPSAVRPGSVAATGCRVTELSFRG